MSADNSKSVKCSNAANWEAIDIFLFTNGQERSPPRKYHLTSERLRLWDTTLNYMARTLYGCQIPTVDLYTLEGNKVETPLELSNGVAYVAVASNETFKPAGYEKYLLRATKNILYNRSWEKEEQNQCCSADCTKPETFQDIEKTNASNAQPNGNPKLYAHLKEIISEAYIVVPGMDHSKAVKESESHAKEVATRNIEGKTMRSAKPNAPVVQPQKQTKTLFRRRLTPSQRIIEFERGFNKTNPPNGKINTNPTTDRTQKNKNIFKSLAKKSRIPKPTHKIKDTLNENFENVPNDVSNDRTKMTKTKTLQNYKPAKHGAKFERLSSVIRLVSMGNSQEVIQTIKAETSDINKHSSVPNMCFTESKCEKPITDKCTSTTDIDAGNKSLEQGTDMSNNNLKVNDTLISLNKDEFQSIVDRIVEKILNEKTKNASLKVPSQKRPKFVYAKVTQSMTEGGLAFDREGRVVSVMNEGEVVNFQVNIEVASIDQPGHPYLKNTDRKGSASTLSGYTSTSTALGDNSQCNVLCECHQNNKHRSYFHDYKRNKNASQKRNKFNEVECKCDLYYTDREDSSHGDVKSEEKAIKKSAVDLNSTESQVKYMWNPGTSLTREYSKNALLETEQKKQKRRNEKLKLLNVSTQTNSLGDILLEVKEFPDGRYTFHLPPLEVLRYYNI